MSRSGYSEDGDYDQWALIRWRGAVASAFRGKKGQAFFKELLEALDSMPEKRIITNDLVSPEGDCCTLGSLGCKRGLDMSSLDPEDYGSVANVFGVNEKIVQEVVYVNDEWFDFQYDENGIMKDEDGKWLKATPEYRWQKMRDWVESQIKKEKVDD